MLWSIDSCHHRISADQCHLTVPQAQVSIHRDRVLFWSYPLTNYWFSSDRGLKFIFFNYMKYVVCMSLWPRTIKILISNSPRTRKFSQFFFKKTCGEDLFLPWSRVGHALRPIFVLWLAKIWQVSSCGKFMQHLENCLLWQVKLTEFCVNLWCF